MRQKVHQGSWNLTAREGRRPLIRNRAGMISGGVSPNAASTSARVTISVTESRGGGRNPAFS
jgi:hypothetical protein